MYWGLLPVPSLIAVIAALRFAVARSVFYDPGWLIPVTNSLFVTLIFLTVAYIAARNYATNGRIQILLLGCGTLIFGLAAAAAGFARGLPGGANLNVTIYNTGALIAALFYFISALILLVGLSPTVGPARRTAWAAVGYLATTVLAGLLITAALADVMAPFFIQGAGPTLLRQAVLGTADVLFVFSFLIFIGMHFRTKEIFLYWYALALALTSISLTAFFIQSSVGSPVGWVGRFSQYLGGVYLIVALLAARRSARERKTSFDKVLTFSLNSSAGALTPAAAESPAAIGRMEKDLRHVYLEASADAFYVKDIQGRYLLFNKEAARITGRQPEEVLGEDDYFLFPDDEAKTVMAGDRKVMEDGVVTTYEEVVQTVDGRKTYLSTKGPLFDDHGNVVGLFGIARDVTEHRKAEDGLRASEIRYRALVDLGPDAIIVNVGGKYAFANPAAARLFGVDSPQELVGRDAINMIHLDYRELVVERSSQALAGATLPPQEIKLLRLDGSPVEVESIGVRVVFGGEPAVQVVYRDITERKQAEADLRESHDLLANLALLVPGVIYQYRLYPDGRSAFPYSSPGMNDIYEVTPEEVREDATPVFGRLHPDDYSYVADAIAESARTLNTFHCEFRVVLPRQGLRWRWSQAQPVRMEDGGTLWHGIISDITEHKISEEALRASEATMHYIIKHDPSAIAVYDRDLRYLAVSDRYVEDYDIDGENIVGKSHYEVFPEIPQKWRDVHQRALAGAIEREKDDSFLRLDGSLTYNSWECRPWYGPDGSIGGIITYTEVTTERIEALEALRQAEEHLHQSQKMEAVGQLAGGIAHDFNNLLTAILGYSQLILANGSSTVDEVRPEVEEIKLAGERARALIQQILAFSRRQALRPQVISLDRVVRGIEPLLRRSIGEDIDLQIIESPSLASVEVDPHQFEQVVMNLVLNARDAMPSGGRITVETANAELDDEFCRTHAGATPGSHVMLRVSDTGVGMDAHVQEHLFEPFFTTKAPGAGTGLGLATVYGIVKQSNGSIFVTSEPRRGSDFTIYLPRAAQPSLPGEMLVPPHVSARGSETIVVVEDEKALQGLVRLILGAVGYRTLMFASAAEALAVLEQGEQVVDLLLTDVMLPGPMQGHELAQTVLASRPHLPVLFMSGYARDALVHAGRLDEGVNLLEKPFTPESLTDAVREVLDMPRGSG